ncbi:apdG [Symbiodinium natans]|uniref:ApdG protein n=1 Tax=Symbiodinium natans TaxID=878477 RepID=A0A812NAZ0_9DINO|nr:apdG [Symbiodinium natans]
MWLAINGDVYDVSKFAQLHPGGAKVLEEIAGRDVTEEFYELHRHDVLVKYDRLKVGRLQGEHKQVSTGCKGVPFAEIPAFQGQESPFYTESHRRFMEGMQSFVASELMPGAAACDLKGEYPSRELQRKLGQSGVMVSRLGPGPWSSEVEKLGLNMPGNINAKDVDYFHEAIAHQEIARVGLPGFVDSLGAGYLISAPAIHHFGTEEMRKTIFPSLLRGEKWSCLAISEPFAGSDVAQIKATAKKSDDGTHYIVNGVKKWITEGAYSDYFVTAVRTGGPGNKGISLLLIERGDGVSTSQMKTTYSTCAGTALVVLEDVRVPVSNLLGKENEGFKLIMYNFNHERWFICQVLLGQMRAALTDAFMWARQRKVFGKPLIEQPVIRNKLASSIAALESMQSYSEVLTYDMGKSKNGPVGDRLAGPIAMFKYQCTRTAWKIADDTVQILGGRGVTHTGMGSKIEGLKNFAKYAAVYGGSEEIMADLAVKQAMRSFPTTARL